MKQGIVMFVIYLEPCKEFGEKGTKFSLALVQEIRIIFTFENVSENILAWKRSSKMLALFDHVTEIAKRREAVFDSELPSMSVHNFHRVECSFILLVLFNIPFDHS